MELKRHYKTPEGWQKKTDKNGNCTNPPPLDYIEVRHTGAGAEQHFSTRLVALGLREGWIALDGDTLTLKAKPENLVYKIVRHPGRWCLHCKAKLPDDVTGDLARAHVAVEHPGVASPDPEYPAGYKFPTHYKVMLDEKQHERFRLKRGA